MREGVRWVDYRKVDWEVDRPDLVAIADDWERTIITPIVPVDPRLSAVVAALDATHVNGGAQLAQFSIEAAPAVAWALSRNRLNEFGLLGRFFRHPSVIGALPAAANPGPALTHFSLESTFKAYGALSGWIKSGGAYEKFAGSDQEALQLAASFMDAACDMRFSETFTWVNWMPWTDWFQDVAWDGTFLWFDTRKGVVTVLLITDTD